jgi:flagellar biosynthesis protein FlhB
MAEHKPHEATPSRLERARREGDVARSQELGNVVAFALALAAVSAIVEPLGAVARRSIEAGAAGSFDMPSIAQTVALMLVPAACGGAGALACAALQTGGLRLTAPSLKFQRLAPLQNVQRMFSREAASVALRATIAFAAAVIAVGATLSSLYGAMLRDASPAALAAAAWRGALHAALAACAAAALFAILDYGMQRAQWLKRLRMSFEELRRDQKEHDGDPLARARRRAVHRSMARGTLRRVKDAAFVVCNPSHIAVALEYRPPEIPVPRVAVRAADAFALRVRELAAQIGIPVIEHVPLARALYASTRAGEVVPQETYVALAEIVAALVRAGAL